MFPRLEQDSPRRGRRVSRRPATRARGTRGGPASRLASCGGTIAITAGSGARYVIAVRGGPRRAAGGIAVRRGRGAVPGRGTRGARVASRVVRRWRRGRGGIGGAGRAEGDGLPRLERLARVRSRRGFAGSGGAFFRRPRRIAHGNRHGHCRDNRPKDGKTIGYGETQEGRRGRDGHQRRVPSGFASAILDLEGDLVGPRRPERMGDWRPAGRRAISERPHEGERPVPTAEFGS